MGKRVEKILGSEATAAGRRKCTWDEEKNRRESGNGIG